MNNIGLAQDRYSAASTSAFASAHIGIGRTQNGSNRQFGAIGEWLRLGLSIVLSSWILQPSDVIGSGLLPDGEAAADTPGIHSGGISIRAHGAATGMDRDRPLPHRAGLESGGEVSVPAGEILFVVWEPKPEIRILDTTSGKVRTVPLGELASGHHFNWPSWSPGGERFSFGEWPSGSSGQASVYVCAVDGTGLKAVTDSPGNWVNPSWSPQGDRILMQMVYGGAYAVTMEDSVPKRLVDGVVSHARWAPDGRRVIGSNWPDVNYQSDLTVYDTVTGTQEQITHHQPGFSYNYASYSPDGTRLAVSGMDPGLGHWKVVVMNADGTGQKFLNSDWKTSTEGGPTWTPDGQYILFSSDYGGQTDMWSMRPDGSGRVKLTNTPDLEVAPFAMRPTPIRFSRTLEVDRIANSVRMILCGLPGGTVRLETSTDLLNWQFDRFVIVDTNGCAEINSAFLKNQPGVFFRSVRINP